MSWFASCLEGLQARRRRGQPQVASIEQVREAMLAALDKNGGSSFLGLKTRIRLARDAQHMWDLRSELMKALASQHGEARAVEELRLITQMFREILPQGLAASLDHHAGSGAGPRAAGHQASGKFQHANVARSQF